MEDGRPRRSQPEVKPFVQPPAKQTIKEARVVPDPSFAAGQQLPSFRRRSDTAGGATPVGIPLQDPDPAYDGFDTFIVVTDRSGTIARFSAHRSMSLFAPLNPVRLSAINILHHWSYTWVMALLVVGNYWTRQMLDTGQDDDRSRWIVSISEILFVSACVFELSLRWIAYGVAVGPFTAMRSPWPWFDVFFILTGILMIWWPHAKLFRLIAALRTLKVVPASRSLLQGSRILVRTKERLFDLAIYAILVIIALAFVGWATYGGGMMSQKCIERMDPAQHFGSAETEEWNRNPQHWLLAESDVDEWFVCGNETRRCPENYICVGGYGQAPGYGYGMWDGFGWAALATVRVVAQDAVDELYMRVPASCYVQQLLYFLTVFFVGTWAIVGYAFAVTASVIEEEEQQKPARPTSEDTLPSPPPEAPGCRSWAHRLISSTAWDRLIIFISLLALLSFAWLTNLHANWAEHRMKIWAWRGTLTVCLLVYVFELGLQFAAEGPRRFVCSPLHVWESFIVTLILAKFVQWYIYDFGRYTGRLLDYFIFTLPVLKLAIRWRALRLVFSVARALPSRYLAIGVLATAVLGEVGVLLFAKDYRNHVEHFPHGNLPRWNLVDLPHAWAMVGRVAAGEWVRSLFQCLLVGNVCCLFYFIATLFIMYLILMHVNLTLVMATVDALRSRNSGDGELQNGRGRRAADEEAGKRGLAGAGARALEKLGGAKKYVGWIGGVSGSVMSRGEARGARKRRAQVDSYEDGAEGAGAVGVQGGTPASAAPPKGLHIPQNGCFQGFQDAVSDLYTHPALRAVSIGVIIASCFALATDDVYINESSSHGLRIAGRVINIIFVAVLFIEVVVKLISCSASGGWSTRLELVLDMLQLIERVWTFFWHRFSTETHLNVVSSLRPLMLVFRLPCALAPAGALCAQIYALFPYLLASAVIWMFFALVSHALYANRFARCVDGQGIVPDHRVVTSESECMMQNYSWIHPELNFDADGEAILSLFAVATFNGWAPLVEGAADARAEGQQPAREGGGYGLWAYTFFVVFALCGVLLLGNMLVGVLVYEFRERGMGDRLLTEGQGGGGEREEEAEDVLPEGAGPGAVPRPENVVLAAFYDLVASPPFEPVVVVILILDAICCLLYCILHHNSPHTLWVVFFWIFTFLYTAELGLKAVAWRWHALSLYPNVLDLVAVIASFYVGVWHFDLSAWALRLFLRCVWLLKYVPFTTKRPRAGTSAGDDANVVNVVGRSVLLGSLARATPALSNLVVLQFILMSVFALLALADFNHIGLPLPPADPLNFLTFCNSFLVMVRLSMVAGWPQVFDHMALEHGRRAAVSFVPLYTLVSILLVTNMFLVLVLEAVEQLRTARVKSGQQQQGRRVGPKEEATQVPLQPLAPAAPPSAGAGTVPPTPPSTAGAGEPQVPPPRRESAVTVNANGENPEAVVVVPN